ncbi:unnamed protein product [Auanema sp. JU1783]|nr:unnamed protein product [Auanema sp. JU1783]
MSTGFESDLNIGGMGSPPEQQRFSLQMFSKPSIVVAHLCFRAAALAYYFFATLLSDSFIIQFLVILILLSMDFWVVKNITGRLLVGLRWWNFVDSNGNNHWKFESAKDTSRFSSMDSRAFWMGLVLAPLVWFFFVSMAFFTFKWEWMIVALLGFGMTSANLYGYLRCRWANSTQLTNYLSRLAFISMLKRNRNANQQGNSDSSNPMQQSV